MPLTIKDIARLCGVSIGTVDRALNGRAGVNPETKTKILRLADEYGYRPDLRARSLVTGKTKTVGVVVFNLRNYFFSQLVTSIDHVLHDRGFSAYPAFTERDGRLERGALSRLASFNADGIILFPVGKGRQYEQYLRSLNIPLVCVGNRLGKAWPFAGIDDAAAELDAVKYAAGLGYTDVIFVAPPLSSAAGQNVYEVAQRLEGYTRGVEAFVPGGTPEVISDADYLSRAVERVRVARSKPAFLCNSDLYALRLLKAFRAAGIRVPQDAGLMGFDNIDVLEFIRPSLSTVDYHIGAIGRAAAEMLLELMDGTAANGDRTSLVTHTIVAGESM